MSSYYSMAINPRTGKNEEAMFLDDYFGRHSYGVVFISDVDKHVHKLSDIALVTDEEPEV